MSEPNRLAQLYCSHCAGFFEDILSTIDNNHRELVDEGDRVIEHLFCPQGCTDTFTKSRVKLSNAAEVNVRTPWDDWRVAQIQDEIGEHEQAIKDLEEEFKYFP